MKIENNTAMERLINVLKEQKKLTERFTPYLLTLMFEDEEYYEDDLKLLYELYDQTDKSMTLTQFATSLCEDY